MEFQQILANVKNYVISYFERHHDPELSYHNLEHTKSVVDAATRLANYYRLNDAEFFTVIAAAWFHDIGYFTDKVDHESKSIELATTFLKEKKLDPALTEKVTGCIKATKMPQSPDGLLQQILCDADLFHLGTDKFDDNSKRLRKEMETVIHMDVDQQHWRQKTVDLLEAHHYFTDYAQLLLNERKERNLQKLKDKQ